MQVTELMPVVAFAGVVLGTVALNSILAQKPRSVKDRIEKYEAGVTQSVSARDMPSLLKDGRHSDIGWLDRLLKKTNFADKIALDLAQAALPLRVAEYILIRWLCALGLAAVSLFVSHAWFTAPVAGLIGFYVPKFYIGHLRSSRLKKIVNQLMDAITLIANSLRSGYSFSQGLDLVTREMPPPISDEFRQVLVEINLGTSAEEALNNFTKRVPSYDVELLVMALIIQRQVGGNLAEVLDNIAHTMRERIRILGEISTRTAQARLSGYIIGLMPFGLMGILSVLNPAYLQELFASPLGIMMFAGGMVMELVGFLIIRRIVAIEV